MRELPNSCALAAISTQYPSGSSAKATSTEGCQINADTLRCNQVPQLEIRESISSDWSIHPNQIKTVLRNFFPIPTPAPLRSESEAIQLACEIEMSINQTSRDWCL